MGEGGSGGAGLVFCGRLCGTAFARQARPSTSKARFTPTGIESLWSMLKRAHKGTFHKLSFKHLDRYVQEFSGRHNVREQDTIEQMAAVADGMDGKRLIAANGLESGARS